jgi:hypothetical protein
MVRHNPLFPVHPVCTPKDVDHRIRDWKPRSFFELLSINHTWTQADGELHFLTWCGSVFGSGRQHQSPHFLVPIYSHTALFGESRTIILHAVQAFVLVHTSSRKKVSVGKGSTVCKRGGGRASSSLLARCSELPYLLRSSQYKMTS